MKSQRKRSCSKGFGALELIVVVCIIAVLAIICVPAYVKYQERTTKLPVKADVSTAIGKLGFKNIEVGQCQDSVIFLGCTGEEWFACPFTADNALGVRVRLVACTGYVDGPMGVAVRSR